MPVNHVIGPKIRSDGKSLPLSGAVQAGWSKNDIVKATVWLTSTDDFGGFNESYAAYFGNTPPPARSTVCTSLMAPKALIEIEVLAYVGE